MFIMNFPPKYYLSQHGVALQVNKRQFAVYDGLCKTKGKSTGYVNSCKLLTDSLQALQVTERHAGQPEPIYNVFLDQFICIMS